MRVALLRVGSHRERGIDSGLATKRIKTLSAPETAASRIRVRKSREW
jgi:hypothetical protein